MYMSVKYNDVGCIQNKYLTNCKSGECVFVVVHANDNNMLMSTTLCAAIDTKGMKAVLMFA